MRSPGLSVMHLNKDRDTNWQNAVHVARLHKSRRIGSNVAAYFTSSKPLIARTLSRIWTGWLIARFLPAYVAFTMLKHMVPLQRLVRLAWRFPAGRRDHEAERRLVASVLRLSQFVGLRDRDCLQRSLLVYRLLSRSGADPLGRVGKGTVYQGARPSRSGDQARSGLWPRTGLSCFLPPSMP